MTPAMQRALRKDARQVGLADPPPVPEWLEGVLVLACIILLAGLCTFVIVWS